MASPIVIEEEEDEESYDLNERIPTYMDQSTSSALVFKAKASLLSQASPQSSLVGFVDVSDSPVTVVEDSDGQKALADVEAEIDSGISILHGAINKHFAIKAEMRTEEELFLLPEDIEHFTLKQKAKLIRDLCDQVCYELISGHATGAWTDFVASRKSDAHFPLRQRDDVIRRIFRLSPSGLHLSGAEVKQLAELMIGASRFVAVSEMQQELQNTLEKSLAMATELSDLRTSMRKKDDQLEEVSREKTKLTLEVTVLKNQLLYLEQQLEDTLVEAYNAQELAKTLQAEMRVLTQEVASNGEFKSRLISTDLSQYLSAKADQTPTRFSRSSVLRNPMRVSFNLTEEAKARGSFLTRQSQSSLVSIIKKKPDLPKSPDILRTNKK